jgi:hypothetical protein
MVFPQKIRKDELETVHKEWVIAGYDLLDKTGPVFEEDILLLVEQIRTYPEDVHLEWVVRAIYKVLGDECVLCSGSAPGYRIGDYYPIVGDVAEIGEYPFFDPWRPDHY